MLFAMGGRRSATARHAIIITAITVVVSALWAGAGAGRASAAAEPTLIEWSTTWTQEETVTINETATYEGYEGQGSATATKSATATGTAKAATSWEVYYWATMDAYGKASAQAKAAAEAEARPIAKQRAEADARAKAAAGPVMIEWSTTWTQAETVTINETATYEGYEGQGSATATKSATATGTAKAATHWEVYYAAIMDAYGKASAQAKAAAEAEARPIAKQRAEADARAKHAAGPVMIEWTTTATQTETVTVTETATVNGYEGYGTATATKSATATGTATEATNWEVYYWATVRAQQNAKEQAEAAADAEARAEAMRLALADAQAKADAAADNPEQDTGSTPTCGNEVLKDDGTPWICTFADDFRGTALDTDKWSPVDTATSQFSYGDCFGADHNVTVLDGALRLSTKREAEPVTCQLPEGPLTTNYTSGAVTSLGKFSQTYGRVEIRAAMPVSNGPGLQSTLWLVPDDPTFYGGWPHSGEIDIAEFFSQYPDRLIPALHYDSLLSWSQRTNNNCLVYKPTSFHTYSLEWTQQKLKISIDGKTCLEHTISPLAPLLGSAPFNRPFNINLTQMLGSGDNKLPAGAEIDEAVLKVDYVRAWS